MSVAVAVTVVMVCWLLEFTLESIADELVRQGNQPGLRFAIGAGD